MALLHQVWNNVASTYPSDKQPVVMRTVTLLVDGLHSHRITSPCAALRLSRADMVRIARADVPLGLYNRLVECLSLSLSLAAPAQPSLHMAIVLRFGACATPDDVEKALAVLDTHCITRPEQLRPHIIAQMPRRMQPYVARKCGLERARGLADEEMEAAVEEAVGSAKDSTANAILHRKEYKKFCLVSTNSPLPTDQLPRAPFTLAMKAPERGWDVSLKKRVQAGLKGVAQGMKAVREEGAREPVVLRVSMLSPEEVEQRTVLAHTLAGCLSHLKSGQQAKRDPLARAVLKAAQAAGKEAPCLDRPFVTLTEGTSGSPTVFLVERLTGPSALQSSGNFKYFCSMLRAQLTACTGIASPWHMSPAAMPPTMVAALTAEIARQTAKAATNSQEAHHSRDGLPPAHEVLLGALLCVCYVLIGLVVFLCLLLVVVVFFPLAGFEDAIWPNWPYPPYI